MTDAEREALTAFTQALARQAMQTVLARRAGATLEIKPDGSPVTSVDKAVEEVLRASIASHYPAHGILGEEFGPKDLDAEWVWVLDPIDGTREFVSGLPTFGCLIALCHWGTPVIGAICQPLTGEVYLGVTGQGAWLNGEPIRATPVTSLDQAIADVTNGASLNPAGQEALQTVASQTLWNVYDGSCLGYGALAAGRLHLCISGGNLDSYDLCALVPVVQGAGGVITNWQGGALGLASRGAILAASSKTLHAAVIERLRSA
ncbi:MAG: inositol monophosphatase family protein [Pseudomonadota bacterium]